MKHSTLSASGAPRWMACPGSIALAKGLPERTNDWATAGTLAHEIAANFLRDPTFAVDPDDPDMSTEMYIAIGVYVTYCEALRGKRWVEMPLHEKLCELHPDFGGTADCVVYYGRARFLEIIDFKYGTAKVSEQDNWQLKLYAIGAALTIGKPVSKIKLTIVQPRALKRSPIRSTECTMQELILATARMVQGARATEAEDAPLVPGSYCWFCPANQIHEGRRVCPRMKDNYDKRVINIFNQLNQESN